MHSKTDGNRKRKKMTAYRGNTFRPLTGHRKMANFVEWLMLVVFLGGVFYIATMLIGFAIPI
jgi:hypothetical protein